MRLCFTHALKFLFLLTASLLLVGARSFHKVTRAALSPGVIARDVRWAGPRQVYVALGKGGVIRTLVDSTSKSEVIVPSADRGGFPVCGLIGRGQGHLLIGTKLGAIGWKALGGTDRHIGQKPLLAVMDIDAFGDSAAILGADSGSQQGLSPDGTIAWVGSLSKGLSNLHPLMRGKSNPGARDMARCSILETGVLRFMPDGSLIVVPGVEPGAYRYSAAGKLLQTWDTKSLGIVDDCSINDEELQLLSRDFSKRLDWYSSRVIVDDILPLSNGPGLVLRRVENGETKWDLVTLPYRGKSERTSLPVTLQNPRGHVRGDVRENETVLLLFEDPLPGQKAAAPPELIVLASSAR